MDILPNIQIIDLALFLKKEKTLVLGDIHIGYEEALNKQGILIPRIYFKEIIKTMESITKGLNYRKVIIVGDLKHEFGKISETEWRNTLKFLDFFKDKQIILIKGNHDTILGPIAQKRNLKVVDYHLEGNCLFVHGHKIINPKEKYHTIILGHEHPAIGLETELRVERFKCFLKGTYKRKNLIVLPSLNPINEGTDILQQQILSPYLKQANLDQCDVYIPGDQTYYFGKIKNLRRM